jgi:hypothetical protein
LAKDTPLLKVPSAVIPDDPLLKMVLVSVEIVSIARTIL